jgi:hypothetical protein
MKSGGSETGRQKGRFRQLVLDFRVLARLLSTSKYSFKTDQNYLQIPELLRDPKPVAFNNAVLHTE